MSFVRALEENPIPRRLGDVSLRYDTPVLIGDTGRRLPGWPGPALLALAVAAGTSSAAVVLAGGPWGAAVSLGGAAGLALAAAIVVEGWARRRRRFVLDFASKRLRLDFTTPATGHPRTLSVPFDAVDALDVLTLGDGRSVLTVDFAPRPASGELLREVLVADVSPGEAEALRRLERLFRGAFALD